jgi:hypothetical protein
MAYSMTPTDNIPAMAVMAMSKILAVFVNLVSIFLII